MRSRHSRVYFGCQLALLTISLLVVSCGRNVPVSELNGEYVVHLPGGIEKLMLIGDGSFRQEVLINGDSVTHNARGTWKYDAATRYLTFDENFLVTLDAKGQLTKNFRATTKRIVVLQVEASRGTLTLIANEDVRYRKGRPTQ